MTRIFVSYRRDDTAYVAGLLGRELQERFGPGSVFIDVDDIPLGVDFREHISEAVEQCDILLCLIGKNWLSARSKSGDRRLHDTTDFVRLEIETALDRNIPVIPVLAGDASMPTEGELPATLGALTYQNAAEIRPGRDLWHHVNSLIERIESRLDAETPAAPIRPPKNKRREPTATEARIAVLGDDSARVLVDFLRSKSVPVGTELGTQVTRAIIAVDAYDGPMPVTREIVERVSSVGDLEVLCVLTNTQKVADIELIELVELEMRELMSQYGLLGDDIFIGFHPAASDDLVEYLANRS